MTTEEPWQCSSCGLIHTTGRKCDHSRAAEAIEKARKQFEDLRRQVTALESVITARTPDERDLIMPPFIHSVNSDGTIDSEPTMEFLAQPRGPRGREIDPLPRLMEEEAREQRDQEIRELEGTRTMEGVPVGPDELIRKTRAGPADMTRDLEMPRVHIHPDGTIDGEPILKEEKPKYHVTVHDDGSIDGEPVIEIPKGYSRVKVDRSLGTVEGVRDV